MKTLRLTGTILLSILIVFCISSCGGDDDPTTPTPTPTPTPVAAKIEIPETENTKPVFNSEGGVATVTFTSTQAWTASVSNSEDTKWLSVSPSSGNAGQYTLTIKGNKNETLKNRESGIIIKSGTASQTISVSQEKGEPFLTLDSKEYKIGSEGGDISVIVKTNMDLTVEIPDNNWISQSSSSTSNQTYTFTTAPNDGYDQRSIEIVFVNQEYELSDKIVVIQNQKDAIIVSKKEFNVSVNGETIEVDIEANVDYSVDISSGWITQADTRALQKNKLSFVVAANSSSDSRTATVIIHGNGLSEVITINQRGFIYVSELSLNKTSIELYVGDTAQLKATIAPTNADNKELQWYSQNSWVAHVDENGLVTARNEGTVIIYVYADNGRTKAECQVTVKKQSFTNGNESFGNEKQEW